MLKARILTVNVDGKRVTNALTLAELDRGIVVRVNELPLIFRDPGDHPPLPLNDAVNPNDLDPSALCPTVIVRSISIIV